MKFFKMILMVLSVFSIFKCNGKAHYHKGGSFIHNPTFKLFGANLTQKENLFQIKSYFKSSIRMRTEYIYENFDISFPDNYEINKEYNITDSNVKIWYAKGGQAGQIETKEAEGTFKILKKTEDSIEIELNLTFKNFIQRKAYPMPKKPIIRNGILKAKKGYELY